ncbi:acetyltransferase [Marinobacterium arenosum]|uniref:acetyltransferase n=1 Tax=Marinobacterium arenosum TaxID=2862496 RepID=UPI001C9724BD|nr:acetyltransferase [Marinobacterium arenosum]MBY4678954.1 acetyltransferase [Marinobacterium arenosum]
MYLKESASGHLVEVIALSDLFDPYQTELTGRSHYGEEAQDPERFEKRSLVFPSGETLPRCWLDPHYRDHELKRRTS